MRKQKIIAFIALLCAAFPASAAEIRVSDFGAKPDDGKCDISAIRKAFAYAVASKATTVRFDAGVYDLNIGDATRDIFEIDGAENLSIVGAVGSDGEPKTVFLRRYKPERNLFGGKILKVLRSPNLSVRGIAFDNFPRYMSCGEIVANDGRGITVKVFEGNPYLDGTYAYCSNLWDGKTGNLVVGKPSTTFGTDVDRNLREFEMKKIGAESERLMRLDSPKVARTAAVGEVFSWNFGWRGHQILFERCDNLRLENVAVRSSIGFCMLAFKCRNIYAKNVEFKREKGSRQMNVGSRDAWKIRACRGLAVVENMYVEGVRWDGQNVHGTFVYPYGRVGKNALLMSNDFGGPTGSNDEVFEVGTKVGFWKNKSEEVLLTIKSVRKSETKVGRNSQPAYEVEFVETVPDFVGETTLCNLYGLNLDSYVLINSTFKNIAGCASLIRNDNVNIAGCTFDHIMYPAVCVGGAIAEVEGVVSKNAYICGNKFVSCGWSARHGASAAVAVRIQPSQKTPIETAPYIENVVIGGNEFSDCNVGIDAAGADGLYISGNKFENVRKTILERKNQNVFINNNVE